MIFGAFYRRRTLAWGSGVLRGDTKIAAQPEIPGRWKATLYLEGVAVGSPSGSKRAIPMRLVEQTWSDAITGTWEFPNIDTSLRYTVVAHDHTGTYDPATKGGLEPEAA